MKVISIGASVATVLAIGVCQEAAAQDLRNGGKLLLTNGVSSIEGAAGGGLATWAVIAGNETRNGIGASVHVTNARSDDFNLLTSGVSVGFFDRLEVSYASQSFNTMDAGATLGLGKDYTFNQDIIGVKLRVAGDAVYDQDKMLPQISVAVQKKTNDKTNIVHAVGADSDSGTDYLVTATKVLLDQSLVVSGAVRRTKANQAGLLGFGGDQNHKYSTEFEGSAGYLVSRKLVIGAEYRSKPDNLGFAKEDDWYDVFGAYAINKNVSLTAAYVDLGDIATFKDQRAFYISLQAGF